MQTYKNYQQCTTILTNKIKYLSVRYPYISTFCCVLTYPESKLKHLFIIYNIYRLSYSPLESSPSNSDKITLIIDIYIRITIIFPVSVVLISFHSLQ